MEGMCPLCVHQRAWSAHAYDSVDGGLVGDKGQQLVYLKVSTAREKVSGGKECIQGRPSAIARGSKGGTQGECWSSGGKVDVVV